MQKSQEKTVTFDQMKALRGLLFWLREKRVLQNFNSDLTDVKESINYAIERCDSLKIPFSIQNNVLHAYNTNNVHVDILDIFAENNITVDYK